MLIRAYFIEGVEQLIDVVVDDAGLFCIGIPEQDNFDLRGQTILLAVH